MKQALYVDNSIVQLEEASNFLLKKIIISAQKNCNYATHCVGLRVGVAWYKSDEEGKMMH